VRPVVIGGGMAGLSAACRLAADGQRPLLLERSPHVGGRAASFHDPYLEEDIDFGQHVMMRCCRAMDSLLRLLGLQDVVSFQPRLSVPVLHGEHRAVLRSGSLPGPLHLAPSLLRYTLLSRGQRIAVLGAGVALLRAQAEDLEPLYFDAWLALHRQGRDAVHRLWDPICVAALNASSQEVSAAAAYKVFVDAFFRRRGADLGLFTVPLSIIATAAGDYVVSRGGKLRTGVGVTDIVVDECAVRGIRLSDGSEVAAGAIVCAVPPWDLAGITSPESRLVETSDRASRLSWSPIVNVHLWFDRPVIEDAFFVAVESPIQAVFDVSRLHRNAPTSHAYTHLVVSQSAASSWMSSTDADILRITLRSLEALVPRSAQARLVQTRVLRHPRATWVPSPLSSQFRPSCETSVRGLFLAGDWIETGWPSTIEGAVLSGACAASRVTAAARS
jgi:hydroxysqualene dehydroxylase